MTQFSKAHNKKTTRKCHMTTLRWTMARLKGIDKVDKYIIKDDNLSHKPTYKLAETPNDIGEENFEELEIADTPRNLTEKSLSMTRLHH